MLKATQAGAKVHQVNRRGKGNVVRAMFRDIDADYYVMVDGDGTYPPEYAPMMLTLIQSSRADMIVGNRMESYCKSGSRSRHFAGNFLLTSAVNYLFDSNLQDLLSGYRVLSKRFVKSIPLFLKDSEVETAISIHSIEVDAKVLEMPIEYSERTEGTESKLNTMRDGFKIAWAIVTLFKDHRPKLVYGLFSTIFLLQVLLSVLL